MRAKRSNGYDDAFMDACREELTVTASDLEDGEYWVARSDAVCGLVCLENGADKGQGEVHALFVDPDRQRQGIGRMLWLKVVERAKTRGFASLHLDADPAAVPFYRAMGCVVVGEAPSGSIAGRMLPRMAILLGRPNAAG